MKKYLFCPICQEKAYLNKEIKGRIQPFNQFYLYHCPHCHFSFIPNPRTDFENNYDESYYQGKGADPWINYSFENNNPNLTIRRYEWQGLLKIFEALLPESKTTAKWLDYGGGLGGLVRFGRKHGFDISGYDPYGSLQQREALIEPLMSASQDPPKGIWDFVTAIEVIEHVIDPLDFLRTIRAFMKEGGVLFISTGNARPFRHKMNRWSYASCPDIHVSFFEPETLALALSKTGFKPVFHGYITGHTEVIKYKILKNLKLLKRSVFFEVLPWHLLSRLTDALYHVTDMPIGVAV
jgi:SAM-dependent methyltransferase